MLCVTTISAVAAILVAVSSAKVAAETMMNATSASPIGKAAGTVSGDSTEQSHRYFKAAKSDLTSSSAATTAIWTTTERVAGEAPNTACMNGLARKPATADTTENTATMVRAVAVAAEELAPVKVASWAAFNAATTMAVRDTAVAAATAVVAGGRGGASRPYPGGREQ